MLRSLRSKRLEGWMSDKIMSFNPSPFETPLAAAPQGEGYFINALILMLRRLRSSRLEALKGCLTAWSTFLQIC
jgi:hypothetical protein